MMASLFVYSALFASLELNKFNQAQDITRLRHMDTLLSHRVDENSTSLEAFFQLFSRLAAYSQ